jgi:hypothetical protein
MYAYKAKERGLVFTLTLEQFSQIIHQPCFYCGTPAGMGMGVDRRDNSIGYVLLPGGGQCVACCKRCNRWKSADSELELFRHAKQIVEYQEQKQKLAPQVSS